MLLQKWTIQQVQHVPLVIVANIMQPTWILASTSFRRKTILSEAGFQFTCVAPEVQEVRVPIPGKLPIWVAETNAQLKASAVAQQHPEAYIIAADTIVVFNDQIFNKPRDMAEAKHMLQTLSGQTHQAITAVNIQCVSAHLTYAFSETSYVTFETLNDNFVDRYLAVVEPLSKAGAYAIQHPLMRPLSKVEGSFANVMGFPIEVFQTWYREHF